VRERVEPSDQLLAIAAAHAGVITAKQAEAYGDSRHVQRRLVTSGQWQRLASGIMLSHSARPEWDAWAWAGLLRAGDEARLAGRAAAYLEGMITDPPERVDILHPHGLRRPPTEHWRFHQERESVGRLSSIGSLRRTKIDDTVLDLAGTDLGGANQDPLHWVSLAIQQRLTTPERLMTALRRRERLANRQELLEILACAEDGVESPLEYHYLHDVELAHGLPTGIRQAAARMAGRSVRHDVYYRAYRVLVELDGQVGHTGEDRFRDFRRDNAALVLGDVTLRYGFYDVRRNSCAVARQVAMVLTARGWQDVLTCCPRCPSDDSG
jgi:very-short-patch-repair endonuclease